MVEQKKKQVTWIVIFSLILVLASVFLYKEYTNRKKVVDAFEQVEADKSELRKLTKECARMVDPDDADFINPNLDGDRLTKMREELNVLNKSISSYAVVRDSRIKRETKELIKTYHKTVKQYNNIMVRFVKQEEINRLFIPEVQILDKQTKVDETDESEELPNKGIKMVNNENGDKIAKVFAMNGKYIVKNLPIVDDLTLEILEKIITSNEEKTSGYTSNGRWEKERDALLVEAKNQIEQIEVVKGLVEKFIEKKDSPKEELREKYKELIVELKKVKNKKAKAEIEEELKDYVKEFNDEEEDETEKKEKKDAKEKKENELKANGNSVSGTLPIKNKETSPTPSPKPTEDKPGEKEKDKPDDKDKETQQSGPNEQVTPPNPAPEKEKN